ncbi:hypothetical protein AB4097_19345 [Microvirga sp. 2MCAF35]|uniref:hypothetical protein n=1 Tax=Microvirga sp. 2MCAF35 TaxID=3232987 RepID=UPI003F945FA4
MGTLFMKSKLAAAITLASALFAPLATAAPSKRMDELTMLASRDCLFIDADLLKQRYKLLQDTQSADGYRMRSYEINQETTIHLATRPTDQICLVIGSPYDETVHETIRKRSSMSAYYSDIETDTDANGQTTALKLANRPVGDAWLLIKHSKEKDYVSIGYMFKNPEGSDAAKQGSGSGQSPTQGEAPKDSSNLLDQMRSGKRSNLAMRCWFSGENPMLVIVTDKVVLLDAYPVTKFELQDEELAFEIHGIKFYFNFKEETGLIDKLGIREKSIACE